MAVYWIVADAIGTLMEWRRVIAAGGCLYGAKAERVDDIFF